MSERSKGDTSSSLVAPVPPTSGRIVNNSLLSASVTGLTFDDFQNKPLLLPAAPPIVHTTPVVSRESTPLVTVGKSSEIDTENLSEINLNETSASTSNIVESTDENSNSLIESTNPTDNSILSQAASSFSQLPSVASSVFSTFSKKFNSSSGRDDYNSNPQLDIQPFATPFHGEAPASQQQILAPPPVFANTQYQQQNQEQQTSQSQIQAPPAEPPTFYSPKEVPSIPSGPIGPPPTSGQNTYRLSAKKKIYAQIPGLSSTHQEQSVPAPQTGILPPVGFQSLDTPAYSANSAFEKPEERKGGLFSLSNLGVPNVLQNLSGLVQTATGITQKVPEPASNNNNYLANQQGQVPQPSVYPQTGQSYLSGVEQVQSTPSAGSFFAPPNVSAAQSSPFFPTQGLSAVPAASVSPQIANSQPPVSTGILFATQPKSTTPEVGQDVLLLGRPQSQENKSVVQPAKSLTPDINSLGPRPESVNAESALQPNLKPELDSSRPPVNFFGLPPTASTNFSRPPPKSVTPESSSKPPTFFVPQPTSGINVLGQQASESSSKPPTFFVPQPTSGTKVLDQHAPESSSKPPTFFVPQPTSGTNVLGQQAPESSSKPPTFLVPQPTSGTTVLGTPPQFFGPTPTTEPTFLNQGPSAAPPTNFFRPPPLPLNKNQAQAPHQGPSLSTTNLFGPPPPAGANYSGSIPPGIPPQPEGNLPPQAKPPPAGPQSSSFRLQKGTRLYKSPFEKTATEYQPQVQVPQNTYPPVATPPVSYFNPQQQFAQSQVQPILEPFATNNSVLPPSLPPAKESSVLFSAATAPPVSKTPEQPPIAQPVSFFNPKTLNSAPQHIEPNKTSAPEIGLKSAAAESNSDSKFAFAKFTDSLDNKQDNQQTSTPTPPVEKLSELDIAEASNPHQIASHCTELDSEITTYPPVDNQNQVSEKEQTASVEQVQKISESEADPETLNRLEEQQTNILPPPPVVSFGTPTQSKEAANFPPPPPHHSFQNKPSSNPYRKGLQSGHSQLPAPPALASFFTPIDQGNNFFQTLGSEPPSEIPQLVAQTNFFNPQEKPLSPSLKASEVSKSPEEAAVLPQSQEPQIVLAEKEPVKEAIPTSEPNKNLEKPIAAEVTAAVQPVDNPSSFYKPDIAQLQTNELPVAASKQEENFKIASPPDSQDTLVPEPVPNLFSGYFQQPAAETVVAPTPILVQRPSLPDPTTFFDSFSLVPSLGVPAPPTEDPNSQRIQNFFNNPPPKELDTVGDLNYNLVGSGLSVQNLQIRSLTPASNLAEPPSSSCSEFSELNSSLSAANRQPLIQAADSTKVSPEEEAIFESPEYQDLPDEIVKELKMANSLLGNNSPTSETYTPAVKHWFYKRKCDAKCVWTPFSFHDSGLLEEAFLKGDEASNVVAVEGGRFDVNIAERTKTPAYWDGKPTEVKRCSWFYKASDSKYVPYEEETADLLEEEYKKAFESCEWHKKIPISAGDTIVFHGPTVIVHFQPQQQIDSWGGATQTITRPRVVKRDLDDFNICDGETHKVDHLLFMVHGIGSACDLKMRSVEEVVDEFRCIALQLVQSHYKNSCENGCVGRVEVLPVSWHSELHSEEFGIDEKLKSITLESIPKLRNFTNDTLLDILFYTSPMFCQKIINTVTSSMNVIYLKYKQRNPQFRGKVSLAGHSLGSLIMFDLLCHQRPQKQNEEKNKENPDEMTSESPVESNQLREQDEGKHITYKMGQAGTGQPFISYPQLFFEPQKFFALGSPIGMFVTIRGIDKLGLDFRLPTCPGFYNIFHPYDPVAYRLEALVNPDMKGIPPVLIPHHKGRKRMHLELKETMTRVGADLKQKFFDTFKTTLDSVNFLKGKNDTNQLKEEVDKLLELQDQQREQTQEDTASTSRSRANSTSTNQSDTDVMEIDFPLGNLNDSKRIDYVLQEAPLEFFNEYLFALSSHVCYWESEDTILFVIKQIYNDIGISPDSQVPQQTMTIERPSSSGSTAQQSPTS